MRRASTRTGRQSRSRVAFWEGVYWSGGNSQEIEIECTAMRFGRTPKECYEDARVLYGPESYTNGSPPAIITKLADKPPPMRRPSPRLCAGKWRSRSIRSRSAPMSRPLERLSD